MIKRSVYPPKARRLKRLIPVPRTTVGRFQRVSPQSWKPNFKPRFMVQRSTVPFIDRTIRVGNGLDPISGNDLRWMRRADWQAPLLRSSGWKSKYAYAYASRLWAKRHSPI